MTSWTTTYQYDVRNQLRTVTAPSDTQAASYDYDYQRRRLARNTDAGIMERGAYEYQARLAARYGFSEEYRTFINKQIRTSWTPSVAKAVNKGETLKGLWR